MRTQMVGSYGLNKFARFINIIIWVSLRVYAHTSCLLCTGAVQSAPARFTSTRLAGCFCFGGPGPRPQTGRGGEHVPRHQLHSAQRVAAQTAAAQQAAAATAAEPAQSGKRTVFLQAAIGRPLTTAVPGALSVHRLAFRVERA